MPSGPKRRKASKKKKDACTTISRSPPTILQGNSDLKSHDGKESDGEREYLTVLSVVFADLNQMEESSNGKIEDTQKEELQEEEKEVVIEGVEEFKPDDELLRETVFDGNSVFVNNTHDGDDSSSSSSSSDDESRPNYEKSAEAVNSEKLEEENGVFDSVVDPVELVVPLSDELTQVAETPVENSGASDVIKYESKENGKKILPFSDENNGFSPVVTEVVSKGIEENTGQPFSDENNGFFPVVTEVVSKGIEENIGQPFSDEKNGFSPVVTEVVSKGIEENIGQPFSDENNGFSPVVTEVVSKGIEENMGQSSIDLDSKENVDNMMQPDGKTGESSGVVDLASKGNVENLLQPLVDLPGVQTSNGDEHTNESEIPESIGYEPIKSVTPRILQPTSWRSCCGMFDVLGRSNR